MQKYRDIERERDRERQRDREREKEKESLEREIWRDIELRDRESAKI